MQVLSNTNPIIKEDQTINTTRSEFNRMQMIVVILLIPIMREV